MAVTTDTLFREAMTHLASGVAVITARRPDGGPCGIAATSLTSYSAHPPSLLVSVWHGSRCHDALAGSDILRHTVETCGLQVVGAYYELGTGRVTFSEPVDAPVMTAAHK